MAGRTIGAAAGMFLALAGTSAKADLAISSKPTENVSCSAGVCAATAKKAVLNVDELTAMLGSGDATVSTGGIAKDIDVTAALSWASTSRLTLDADKSLIVKQPMTVAGSGALTISTNGGHQTVDLEFFGKGSVQFWDLSSSLVINGKGYTLVGDIATLAAAIAVSPGGSFALANPYDAAADGTYTSSPIATTFNGTFEGLGNVISNLTIDFPPNGRGIIIGLFNWIGSAGIVRNARLIDPDLEGLGSGTWGGIGPLAGLNNGHIDRSSATGVVVKISDGTDAQPGGLVGDNPGAITNSFASASIDVGSILSNAGGLAGGNEGSISASYAAGSISSGEENNIGGLIGLNDGVIENAFSVASVTQRHRCCGGGNYGGLAGQNSASGRITSSYAAGKIRAKAQNITLGGLVGFDGSAQGGIATSYWDLDMGVSDSSRGAGNIANDPGIMGLTTAQFQSGLPDGFDPSIWRENPKINGGFPYLFAIPSK